MSSIMVFELELWPFAEMHEQFSECFIIWIVVCLLYNWQKTLTNFKHLSKSVLNWWEMAIAVFGKVLQNNAQLFCDNLYLLANRARSMSHSHLQVKICTKPAPFGVNVDVVFCSTSNAFFFLFRFLIVTDHLLKCPELVKALYAKLSNQER